GMVSASAFSGSAAFAQRLGNWIPGDFFRKSIFGIKASVLGQSIVNRSTLGLAFDAGYMFEAIPKTLYFGAVAYNLGTQFQAFTQPIIFKLGGSVRIRDMALRNDRLILAVESDAHVDTGFKGDVGAEYKMSFDRDDVAFRAGYRSGSDLG